MKLILVLAFVAVAAAIPVDVQLQEYQNEINPDGEFKWGFSQSDGNNQQAEGVLKTVTDEDNKPRSVLVQSGTFNYFDADGKPHLARWIADENGFQIQSDVLPNPPQPSA